MYLSHFRYQSLLLGIQLVRIQSVSLNTINLSIVNEYQIVRCGPSARDNNRRDITLLFDKNPKLKKNEES